MASKTKPEHPPYAQLVTEAIRALRERDGSSAPAICKAIGEKYGDKLKSGVVTWEKQVSMQLKRMAAAGKLVKVKNSYKLGDELKKEAAKKARKPRAPKPKAEGAEKEKKEKTPASAKKPKPAGEKKKAAPKKKAAAPKAEKGEKKKKATPKKKAPAKEKAVKKSPTKKAAPKKPKAAKASPAKKAKK